MNYWLVRSKWGGEDKKSAFINNDEWINGSDTKYLEVVNRVEVEDVLLLAEESVITHYGVCSENYEDGKQLIVDKWTLLKDSISFPEKNKSAKTIIKIMDEESIKLAQDSIKETLITNDIKIKELSLENFTVFKNEKLEFSDGLNILIGENSTGKTHLLKLLYVFILVNNSESISFNNIRFPSFFRRKLDAVFKPDELDHLINKKASLCHIAVDFKHYKINYHFDNDGGFGDDGSIDKLFKKEGVFIPVKEILSFYEGFIALNDKRELSFDEIYSDLAKKLAATPLRNIKNYPKESILLDKLEQILDGKILLERGRFYLVSNDKSKTEISLIAEGLRKIGTISHLIANGSLNKDSILIWDEPEANLNPKLIKKIAEVLVELSRAGMQIFIATHSLFLIKEIEILRKKEDEVKYFGLGFDENKEVRLSQSEDFEYLDDIIILDEEIEQDDRFMSKEDD